MPTHAGDVLRRVPPQNIEAEESVLGAILLDNDSIDRATEVLEVDDFYRESHRQIFDAMLRLRLRAEPIDAVLLTDELRAHGMLEQVGGPAYIGELAMRVPTAANLVHYARIVREKAALRRLATAATEIASAAYDSNGEDVFAFADREISKALATRTLITEPDFGALVSQAASGLDHPDETTIPTGYAEYDRKFGGFHPGEMVLVAALSSRGKTTWALNVAVNLARAKYGVLFISLEMASHHLAARYIHAQASIDAAEIRTRGLYESEYARVERAIEEAQTIPLAIRYRPGCRPREVIRLARAFQRAHGLDLIVFDYLQLGRSDRKGDTREQDLDEMARELKIVAGELGAACLTLAQLNNEIHRREDPAPRLSDLRGSGAPVQHADTVGFIWSATTKVKPTNTDELVNFTVAKSRNGPTGQFQLMHRPRFVRFENIKREETE